MINLNPNNCNQISFKQFLEQSLRPSSQESIENHQKIRKAFEVFADSYDSQRERFPTKKQKIKAAPISSTLPKSLIKSLQDLTDKNYNVEPLVIDRLPDYFTRKPLGESGETIQVLEPSVFRQLKYTKAKKVEQGDFSIIQPNSEKDILITFGLTSCIALAARALDQNGQILHVGLAHYDGIDIEGEELVPTFLQDLRTPLVKTIELFLIGGNDSLDKELNVAETSEDEESEEMGTYFQMLEDIKLEAESEEIPKVSLVIKKQIINPYQVKKIKDSDDEYAMEFDLLGYTSHAAIKTNGDILVSFQSILPKYEEETMKRLKPFISHDIHELKELACYCQTNPIFKNELINLLVAISSTDNLPELTEIFKKGIELFVSIIKT